MVSVDINTGSEILDVLDSANVKVAVALLALLSEYEDWRLVLAARRFDTSDPRDAYRLFNESLIAAGVDLRKIPPIVILPTTEPFIRELRRIFGKTQDVNGTRLGSQLIGDRFVQDAYVYRIS